MMQKKVANHRFKGTELMSPWPSKEMLFNHLFKKENNNKKETFIDPTLGKFA